MEIDGDNANEVQHDKNMNDEGDLNQIREQEESNLKSDEEVDHDENAVEVGNQESSRNQNVDGEGNDVGGNQTQEVQ